MVTGDALLTALYTATGCGILGTRKNKKNLKIDELETDMESMSIDNVSIFKSVEEKENNLNTSTGEKNVLVLTLLHHSDYQKKIKKDSNGTKTHISSSSEREKILKKIKNRRQLLVWCDTNGNSLYLYRREKVSKINEIKKIKNKGKISNKNKYGYINKNKNVNENEIKNKKISKENDYFYKNKSKLNLENNHCIDTENLMVSMSARELSVLGGFDLATTGHVVSYLANQGRFKNYNRGDMKKKKKSFNKIKSKKRRKVRTSLYLDDLESLIYFKVCTSKSL